MLDDLKRLFRHGGIYLLGNLLNRIGAFLLLPLYTKYLPVADYGILEVLYVSVAVLSVICAAGLSHTTLRFYFDEPDERGRNAVVSTNLILVTLSCLCGALVVLAFGEQASHLLFDSGQYRFAIALCLCIMVLEMSTEVGFAFLRAIENSALFVWLSFLRLLLQLGMSIYLVAYREMGIEGVLIANAVSAGVGWMVVTGYAIQKCGLVFRRSLVTPMVKYSVPMAVGGVLASVSVNVDRLMMKEYLSLEAVGLFALASKFAMILAFLVSEPFSRAYGPFRFSILGKPDAAAIQSQAVTYLVAIASLTALGIALFTPEVLVAFAGREYHAAGVYVPVLLAAGVVSAASYCFETGILAAKRTVLLLYAALAALMAKVVLNILLLPVLQIHGATLAVLLAAIIQTLAIHAMSQRMLPVAYRLGRLGSIMVLAIACFLPSLLLPDPPMLGTFLGKAAIALMFVVVLLACDQELRTAARMALAHLRTRARPGN
ncbi:MAG: oligosaccharide flippase family protein [Betaproteobacteria bacterium]|nr:oligosaccharide flippase family protein [Betaproteobacteria bacterium]